MRRQMVKPQRQEKEEAKASGEISSETEGEKGLRLEERCVEKTKNFKIKLAKRIFKYLYFYILKGFF